VLDYAFPVRNDRYEDREQKYKVFAAQVCGIVDELAGDPFSHKKVLQLGEYLAADAVSCSEDRSPYRYMGRSLRYEKRDSLREALMNNRVLTAISLGDITDMRLSWVTGFEVLEVHVAGMLVEIVGEEIKDVDSDVRLRLRRMLGVWKRSENEGVRRKGWEIEEGVLGEEG
jgi:hypothetical protein